MLLQPFVSVSQAPHQVIPPNEIAAGKKACDERRSARFNPSKGYLNQSSNFPFALTSTKLLRSAASSPGSPTSVVVLDFRWYQCENAERLPSQVIGYRAGHVKRRQSNFRKKLVDFFVVDRPNLQNFTPIPRAIINKVVFLRLSIEPSQSSYTVRMQADKVGNGDFSGFREK